MQVFHVYATLSRPPQRLGERNRSTYWAKFSVQGQTVAASGLNSPPYAEVGQADQPTELPRTPDGGNASIWHNTSMLCFVKLTGDEPWTL